MSLLKKRKYAAVRERMVKKRTLCLSIIAVFMILSRLYSGPQPMEGENPITKQLIALAKEKKRELERLGIYGGRLLSSNTFANEEVPLKPHVEEKLKLYLSKASFKSRGSYDFHQKAEEFLPVIDKILKEHGIPEDFRYIPLVESGLRPTVVSHKGAGGYWQFMPATARLYGLKVNGKVDERLDLVKSTHAAARYLSDLYKQFEDWTLVAAAYNVGGGSLRASIRRQKTNNYFDLSLNRETGAYVYKLISMKEIIERPQKYGYTRYADIEPEKDSYEENIL